MKGRQAVGWFAFAAIVGAAAMGLSSSTLAYADSGQCGGKENPCPMQKWMRTYVGNPMAAKDLAGVAVGLDKAAALSPDATFTEWASLSKAGADAARKGDMAGTKASCKNCHDKYKNAYRDKYRTKAVP